MTDQIVETLRSLLAAEQGSLATRLVEAKVYVAPSSLGFFESVSGVDIRHGEHCRWLTDLIRLVGGAPAPRMPDTRSGNLHYLDVEHLKPLLVDDLRATISLYERAAGVVGENPRASDLVLRISSRHRDSLTALSV